MHSSQAFEELTKDSENHQCFDCGKKSSDNDRKPVHWASAKNSLCQNCAEDYRSFGENGSYISSITMASWRDYQLQSIVGNKRFKILLTEFNMAKNKEDFYRSKFLGYHPKSIKHEINRVNEILEKPQLKKAMSDFYESKISSVHNTGSFDLKTNFATENSLKRFNSIRFEINLVNGLLEKPQLKKAMSTFYKSRISSASNNGSFEQKTTFTSCNPLKRFNSISNEESKFYSSFSLFNRDTDNKQILNKYNTNNGEIDYSSGSSFGHDSDNVIHRLAVNVNNGVNYLFRKLFGSFDEKSNCN